MNLLQRVSSDICSYINSYVTFYIFIITTQKQTNGSTIVLAFNYKTKPLIETLLSQVKIEGKLSRRQNVARANCLRANCRKGKLSQGQTVARANCRKGKLSRRQTVHGQKVCGQTVFRRQNVVDPFFDLVNFSPLPFKFPFARMDC